MTDQSDTPAPKSAAATMAELVARKAAARTGQINGPGSPRAVERDAAARAAAKSKPAMRR